MMQNYEIEIFCPEEYTKKNADAMYSDVIKTTYYSTTCEKERPVNIVLPVGYSEEREYPVLYVLHGIFGTQNDMNKNSIIIQNMMTEGIAKDMIVVYPYMYASKTRDVCTAIDKENLVVYDNFVNELHGAFRCGMAQDLISGKMHDFGGGSELPPYSAYFWKMER